MLTLHKRESFCVNKYLVHILPLQIVYSVHAMYVCTSMYNTLWLVLMCMLTFSHTLIELRKKAKKFGATNSASRL